MILDIFESMWGIASEFLSGSKNMYMFSKVTSSDSFS